MAVVDDGQQTSEPMDEEAPHQLWLVCANDRCGLPLIMNDELVEEKFDSWKKVTWTYEMPVLDHESIWCYSATNAHDRRFDVVRTLPTPLDRSLECRGRPDPEFSWFPGYSWSMAHCRQCGVHLGWGFSPDEEPPSEVCSAARDVPMDGEKTASSTAGATAFAGADREMVADGAPLPAVAGQPPLSEPEPEQRTAPAAEAAAATEAAAAEAAPELPPLPPLAFFGLVLTKMREKELQGGEVERRFAELAELRSQLADRRRTQRASFRTLIELLHGAPGGVGVHADDLEQMLVEASSDGAHDPTFLAHFEAAVRNTAAAVRNAMALAAETGPQEPSGQETRDVADAAGGPESRGVSDGGDQREEPPTDAVPHL